MMARCAGAFNPKNTHLRQCSPRQSTLAMRAHDPFGGAPTRLGPETPPMPPRNNDVPLFEVESPQGTLWGKRRPAQVALE